MKLLRRFADARLQSELSAQKSANLILAKRLKFEKARADALSVNKRHLRDRNRQLRRALEKV